MTLIKFKNRSEARTFNNLMNDFFEPFSSMLKDDFVTTNFKQFAPINVIELEDGYKMEIVAPGLEKEDLNLVLTRIF